VHRHLPVVQHAQTPACRYVARPVRQNWPSAALSWTYVVKKREEWPLEKTEEQPFDRLLSALLQEQQAVMVTPSGLAGTLLEPRLGAIELRLTAIESGLRATMGRSSLWTGRSTALETRWTASARRQMPLPSRLRTWQRHWVRSIAESPRTMIWRAQSSTGRSDRHE